MRYGLSFLPDATPAMKSATDFYADALSLSVRADEAGLSFVKITEHYLHPYGGYCPSPVAFLSAVAARTRQIRLLTGGVLPVFHHPIQLAAETSMLDAISGGRAEIGFARAYMPYEFNAFQVELDGSRERFIATIDAVIRLWRESNVTIENEFFKFRNANTLPPCTQRPHPPVWIAAVQSRQSFAWIGKQGHKLLITPGISGYDSLSELVSVYRECFSEQHSSATPEVAISLPVYIHESDTQARERGDVYLGRYLRIWADAAKSWNSTVSTDYPRYAGFGQGLKFDSPAAMRERHAALIGPPQQVIDGIHWLKDKLGIDALLLQIDFGAMPGSDARSNLELFIDAVAPACR
jgi:alkanesulfonate monooxygenase SsuD/methylene tetrahydromethanopterin reductase-like flavin-dependent oxidoreductase (luciferase family)